MFTSYSENYDKAINFILVWQASLFYKNIYIFNKYYVILNTTILHVKQIWANEYRLNLPSLDG